VAYEHRPDRDRDWRIVEGLKWSSDGEASITTEHADLPDRWHMDPELFCALLDQHMNWRGDHANGIWISAYTTKTTGRKYVKNWLSNYPKGACCILKIATEGHDMLVYKAIDLLEEFNLKLSPVLEKHLLPRHIVNDEYLIFRKMPNTAIVSTRMKTYTAPEQRYTLVRPPPNPHPPPYWKAFSSSVLQTRFTASSTAKVSMELVGDGTIKHLFSRPGAFHTLANTAMINSGRGCG
jgi:hypothetical protein